MPRRVWLLGLCAALATTVPAWLPWLDPQLNFWQGSPGVDDAEHHLLRLYMLDWLVRRGAWFPRWVPDLFLGYGYPIFNFYAPGWYYAALVQKALLRQDVWDAYRSMGVTATLLGAAGAYTLVVSIWRRVVLGIFAAVCLVYFPYSFQVNLFRRGDVPEILALALIPWLLYTLWRLWEAHGRAAVVSWVLLAAATGVAVILTHNLTALLAAFIATSWVAGLLALRTPIRTTVLPELVEGRGSTRAPLSLPKGSPRTDGVLGTPHVTQGVKQRLPRIVLAGALAVGTTAFFWLPIAVEGSAVQLEWLRTEGLNYRVWFVRSDGTSFREEHPENRQTRSGLIDTNLHYPHQLVAPPKASLGQATVGVLALVVLAGSLAGAIRRAPYSLPYWSRDGAPSTPDTNPVRGEPLPVLPELVEPRPSTSSGRTVRESGSARRSVLAAALLATAALAWFFTLAASGPVWDVVWVMSFLQFPWRWMGPFGICLALGASGAFAAPLALLDRLSLPARRIGVAAVCLMAAAVMFNSLGVREFPILDPPEHPDRAVDGRRLRRDEVEDALSMGTTSGREFFPREMVLATYTRGAPRGAQVFEFMYPELDWSGGLLLPLSGDLRFIGWRTSPVWISARVANDSATPATLGIHQARFLGWRAWIDGKPVEIGLSPYIEQQQANPGFMVLAVPPGEHTVVLAFGPTPARQAGVGLTLLTIVACVAGSWVALRPGTGSRRAQAAGGAALVLTVALVALVVWRTVSPAIHRFAARPPIAPTVEGTVLRVPGLRAPEAALLVNLAEAVRTGQARVASPGGGRLGVDPYVDVRYQTVTDTDAPLRGEAGTSRRQWLYLHPPAAVSVDVQLPAGRQVWFQTALALSPEAWLTDIGDGVRFQVLVSTLDSAGAETGQTTVLDEEVNPRAQRSHRRWSPAAADLSRWAGSTVRVRLQTHPRTDLTYDWSGWANPVIFVRETARAEPITLRPIER